MLLSEYFRLRVLAKILKPTIPTRFVYYGSDRIRSSTSTEAPHVDKLVHVWHTTSLSEASNIAGYDNVLEEHATCLRRLSEQYVAAPGELVAWLAEWGPRPLPPIPSIASFSSAAAYDDRRERQTVESDQANGSARLHDESDAPVLQTARMSHEAAFWHPRASLGSRS